MFIFYVHEVIQTEVRETETLGIVIGVAKPGQLLSTRASPIIAPASASYLDF